ncbi:hypothetical protein [Bradyrhizobium sp. CCBAU 051011]|nr:hypothetical protein [Bradyrhizobium sp. CCBAU 051011]
MDRKAPVELSIAHKFSFDDGTQRDIGEARQPAPLTVLPGGGSLARAR